MTSTHPGSGGDAPRAAAQQTAPIEVSVWRGGERGSYVTYAVPTQASQTVLDVVTYIQRVLDPTLSYRFACRVGVCGSCAMTVNGRPRWTCRTHISKVVENGRLEIAPLANMPVIKDLAADMRVFFEKWQAAQGRFQPSQTRADPIARIAPAARTAIDKAIECINCGVCYAACDAVRWNEKYLGPAALNRAWTLVNDARDAGNAERLRAVSAEGGCQSCHTHTSCAEHCPANLDPTGSIASLKRRAVEAYLKGEI
ncbi:MAG: succinate dehydrogenase/fumarate reductase iron-sulfur subunit [Hyphomicrobiaceae bacterium]|nr:succinate dehydrogenase/fumarate reductase iron-sulfur subunit [Hyphomicrobiaceae bacterium]